MEIVFCRLRWKGVMSSRDDDAREYVKVSNRRV
jgi:hypothetical protein